MSSWHVANLTDLRRDAVAWTMFRQWHGPRSCSQLDYYLEIEVKPWEELLMSIRKSERRNARSALRRAERTAFVAC